MKAAAYATRIREDLANPPLLSAIYQDTPPGRDGPAGVADVVIKWCFELLKEARTLAESRGAKTDGAWISTVYEQHEKWRSIVRRLDDPRITVEHFEAFCTAKLKVDVTGGKA